MTAGRTLNTISQDWGTPAKYVLAVRDVFGGQIDLDPCSNKNSIVHARVEYCLPRHDGLRDTWNFPTIYVNPPYGIDKKRGTSIKDWLRRCALSHKEYRAEVLALVPVATNTRHWKNYVFGRATGVCFLYDTRLKFLVNGQNGGKGAPMSCAMIYWGRDFDKFRCVFRRFGAVVDLRPLKGQKFGECSENGQTELSFDESKRGKK
ncbi:MAG TPA: N-6 DNA methylase [Planctomycetes bacterium]|nr:N-6 DNA methylase [Planctomycetota bacterium]